MFVLRTDIAREQHNVVKVVDSPAVFTVGYPRKGGRDGLRGHTAEPHGQNGLMLEFWIQFLSLREACMPSVCLQEVCGHCERSCIIIIIFNLKMMSHRRRNQILENSKDKRESNYCTVITEKNPNQK